MASCIVPRNAETIFVGHSTPGLGRWGSAEIPGRRVHQDGGIGSDEDGHAGGVTLRRVGVTSSGGRRKNFERPDPRRMNRSRARLGRS